MECNECQKCVPWGLSSTMDVTSSVFQACLPPLAWWHVSQCYLYCATSFDIDTLLWHEWKFPGTTTYRDERGERRGGKHSEKVRRKVRRKTRWKTRWKFCRRKAAVWDLSRLLSFRFRDLVGNRFLVPFPRRSGSVAGFFLSFFLSFVFLFFLSFSLSLSAQCSPLSHVMRLNVLKDFIHPIPGATLIKTSTCHDMW